MVRHDKKIDGYRIITSTLMVLLSMSCELKKNCCYGQSYGIYLLLQCKSNNLKSFSLAWIHNQYLTEVLRFIIDNRPPMTKISPSRRSKRHLLESQHFFKALLCIQWKKSKGLIAGYVDCGYCKHSFIYFIYLSSYVEIVIRDLFRVYTHSSVTLSQV